jgi:ABC-2 type transport system permease protein
MISYVLISSFVSSLGYSGIAFKIASQVRDGTIGNELVKPINYKHMIMFSELGENVFHSVCVRLPIVILFGIIVKAILPVSSLNFILFLTSVILGITLVYGLNFIYGILAFWLKTSEYVNFISRALMTLFAGSFIPLWFYPKSLYKISQILPFRFITFEPMQIYLGKVDFGGGLHIIGFQALWIIILTIIQKLMWRAVQKHLIINGG